MLRLLLYTGLLFSAAASADWKIGGQALELSACPQGPCLISTQCLKASAGCQALVAWKNKHKGVVGPGGSNPGSAVCSQVHKAGVVIALDGKGGSEAFCRFADGSLITLDGLWHW